MKHWVVQHADGSTSKHTTKGDDLAAEGIDAGVASADCEREPTDDEVWDWRQMDWKSNLASLADRLCSTIDDERRSRASAHFTGGAAVALTYSRKSAEVRDYYQMGSRDLDALDTTAAASRFPFLAAEAAASGEALGVVAARVRAAAAASDAALAHIDAKAIAAKAAVRAAGTASAARAAATVDWSE
jgi:hypothetical protein